MADDRLQFDNAEAAGDKPSGPVCAVCGKPLATYYWEAGGQVVCTSCKNQLASHDVKGVQATGFLRAGLFGLVGAAAGAGVYYGVLAATGYEVGLISILVGFLVGWTVRVGARGQGGRRYQLMAVLLTYLAIGATYVPLAIREMRNDDSFLSDSTLAAAARSDSATGRLAATGADSTGAAGESPAQAIKLSPMLALAALVAFALVLPVLMVIGNLPSSLISALIIGFGMHQAWRMNGRVNIQFSGPFKVGAEPAGGAAGA